MALSERIVDVLKLRKSDCGLEFIHLAVDAGSDYRDFVDKSEVFQVIDAFLGFLVRTDDCPSFECREHLGSVKAEDGKVSMPQNAAPFILDRKGMGRVIDHLETVVIGDGLNSTGVTGPTIDMDRENGSRLRRDCRLNLGRVEIERFRVDIDENRLDSVPEKRVGGSNEAVGRRDHLARYKQSLKPVPRQ